MLSYPMFSGTHFTYPQRDRGLSQLPARLSWEWVLNPQPLVWRPTALPTQLSQPVMQKTKDMSSKRKIMTPKLLDQEGLNSSHWPHQPVTPRGISSDQLGNWQSATRCHCCLHYNIIMSSNQIVYHNNTYNVYNAYNMYNVYEYNMTIESVQLWWFGQILQ